MKASLVSIEKLQDCIFYIISVSLNSLEYQIKRTYDDFLRMHIQLIAPILKDAIKVSDNCYFDPDLSSTPFNTPVLPPHMDKLTKAGLNERFNALIGYIQVLFTMPPAITQNEIFITFFKPWKHQFDSHRIKNATSMENIKSGSLPRPDNMHKRQMSAQASYDSLSRSPPKALKSGDNHLAQDQGSQVKVQASIDSLRQSNSN